jgi:GTPase Era involved in 16S rRNA processing
VCALLHLFLKSEDDFWLLDIMREALMLRCGMFLPQWIIINIHNIQNTVHYWNYETSLREIKPVKETDSNS